MSLLRRCPWSWGAQDGQDWEDSDAMSSWKSWLGLCSAHCPRQPQGTTGLMAKAGNG